MSNIKRWAVSWKVPIILCITAFVGIFVIAEWGDDHPKPPRFPKIVHNECTGKWAIQTDEHISKHSGDTSRWYVGINCTMITWNPKNISDESHEHDTDTIKTYDTSFRVQTPYEHSFPDSMSAINFLRYRADQAKRTDSLLKRQDSIDKCLHTYK